VEQKSRKSKNESIIYMLMGKGENYFISSSDDNAYDAGKKFMNGFVEQAAAFKLDLDIKAQEEAVKDAEKKLDKLKDNEKDMNKKIDQLQKDLKKNQEDQKNQEQTIENEKKKLEDLKEQVKNE
jgi:peptidoglycan hydrolase CwlO-like protein